MQISNLRAITIADEAGERLLPVLDEQPDREPDERVAQFLPPAPGRKPQK